jgi:hypothetical protein
MIAARDVPAGDDGYTWFISVYGVRWLLLVAVAVPWAAMREVPEAQWRSYKMKRPFGDWYDGLMPSSPFWAQGYWSLLDLAVALLTLFLLGVGFFFLPVAAIAAGLLRFANWVRKPPEEPQPCKSTIYVNLEDADTACGYPTPSNVTPGLYLS